jgi:flagella basal body P-ring formation protein FlgA
LFASTALLLLLGTATVATAPADETLDTPAMPAVSAAIRRAVEARVGRDVAISVWAITALRVNGDLDTDTIVAVPDPATRFGQPARFVLNQQLPGKRPTRIGDATATLQAVANSLLTSREVARGTTLSSTDVAVASTDLSGRTLKPLPTLAETVGSRVTRDLVMRDIVTHNDIASAPLIRTGDIVRAHARVGAVEVTGQLVAAEGGRKNDVIRVINQDTRFAVRARVIEKGEVEVLNVR